MSTLNPSVFFDRDPCEVAIDLLGKVLRHRVNNMWLSAQIIETEAYYLEEKSSHSSLGYTEKRKALFMPAGTIYMYYARGSASFNVSCRGHGNAVLLKAGYPYEIDLNIDERTKMIRHMQKVNPVINLKNGQQRIRPEEKLCSGQTLLCRSLELRVRDWRAKDFDMDRLRLEETGYQPDIILQTKRLGIPEGRDDHLPYRFVDKKFARFCTKKPVVEKDVIRKIAR